MCNRYRLKDPKAAFDWMEVEPAFPFVPRLNIAPTQRVAVVTGRHGIEEMTWGIVPRWAKEVEKGPKALFNARSETVREKRTFKSAIGKRRCLVPADGFYEWSRIGRRPHIFTVRGGGPFAMGGIWESSAEGNRCCLLTTAANALLLPVHDRMPVIVRKEDWEEWWSGGELEDAAFARVTGPYAGEEMEGMEVRLGKAGEERGEVQGELGL